MHFPSRVLWTGSFPSLYASQMATPKSVTSFGVVRPGGITMMQGRSSTHGSAAGQTMKAAAAAKIPVSSKQQPPPPPPPPPAAAAANIEKDQSDEHDDNDDDMMQVDTAAAAAAAAPDDDDFIRDEVVQSAAPTAPPLKPTILSPESVERLAEKYQSATYDPQLLIPFASYRFQRTIDGLVE